MFGPKRPVHNPKCGQGTYVPEYLDPEVHADEDFACSLRPMM